MKHWNYEECPLCGSSLDFGEKCDCTERTIKQIASPANIKPAVCSPDLVDRTEPQMRFVFEGFGKKAV